MTNDMILIDDEPTKASDFVDPVIQKALFTMALSKSFIGMDRGTLDYSVTITGRFEKPKPDPTKRAKAKAARKQRRKQK